MASHSPLVVVMAADRDHAVHEIEQLQFELRKDLRFSLQPHDGGASYVIEDPLAGVYFRVGLAEFEFISELQSGVNLARALAHASARLGDDAFTLEEATAICQWLLESGLAVTADSRQAALLFERSDKLRRDAWRRKANPLFLRLPLIEPDQLFRGLAPLAATALSWPAILIWLAVVLGGGAAVATHWPAFARESARVWLPDHWLWIGLAWVVLKLLHETAHGAVCRNYGGPVPEGGLYFILFMPIPYVDVTSSWRFASKWQRIATAAAGMYLELFLAGLAALVWTWSSSEFVRAIAHNVMLTAGLVTLLFNLNVLMRFDGYYMLADWLEIPNLYGRGSQYLNYLFRRYYLGMRVTSPLAGARHARFIALYAWLSFAWRWVVTFGLAAGAVAGFGAIGWIIAAMIVGGALLLPAFKLSREALSQPTRSRRFVWTTAGLAAACIAAAVYLPWPFQASMPAVADYAQRRVVRNDSAGFIRKVHVAAGQAVSEGELLVTLDNPQVVHRLADLRLLRDQLQVKRQRDLKLGQLAAWQARENEQRVVEHQLADYAQRVAALEVRAPAAGIVLTPELDALLGQYADVGTELVALGEEDHKELVVCAERRAGQADDEFAAGVQAWIWGGPSWALPAPEFEPTASRTPPHPALAATAGGAAAVRTAAASSQTDGPGIELATPSFRGRIPLSAEHSLQVRAGQRATLWGRAAETSILQHLWQTARRAMP